MTQSASRFLHGIARRFSPPIAVYASRLGSLVDTVLRGLDRIFGGFGRPVLQPVPARVPSSGNRRRA